MPMLTNGAQYARFFDGLQLFSDPVKEIADQDADNDAKPHFKTHRAEYLGVLHTEFGNGVHFNPQSCS